MPTDTHGAHSEQDAIKLMADVKTFIQTWFRANTAFLVALEKGEAARARVVRENDPPMVSWAFELGVVLKPLNDKVAPAARVMIAGWVLAEIKRQIEAWTKHD